MPLTSHVGDNLPQLLQRVHVAARDDRFFQLDESHGCHCSGSSFHSSTAASSLFRMYPSCAAGLMRLENSVNAETLSFSLLKFSADAGSWYVKMTTMSSAMPPLARTSAAVFPELPPVEIRSSTTT